MAERPTSPAPKLLGLVGKRREGTNESERDHEKKTRMMITDDDEAENKSTLKAIASAHRIRNQLSKERNKHTKRIQPDNTHAQRCRSRTQIEKSDKMMMMMHGTACNRRDRSNPNSRPMAFKMPTRMITPGQKRTRRREARERERKIEERASEWKHLVSSFTFGNGTDGPQSGTREHSLEIRADDEEGGEKTCGTEGKVERSETKRDPNLVSTKTRHRTKRKIQQSRESLVVRGVKNFVWLKSSERRPCHFMRT